MLLGTQNHDRNTPLGALTVVALAMPLAFALASAAPVQAQSSRQIKTPPRAASARPLKFEVVSIRQNKNIDPRDCPQRIGAATPDGYRMTCMWMIIPIMQAYPSPQGPATIDASHELLKGFPPWLGKDRYDINARVDPKDLKNWQNPKLRPAMMRAMLRSMLKDRLKLAVHHGTEMKRVYLLELGKDGPRFKPTVAGEHHVASPYQMRLPGGGENVLVRQGDEIIHHQYGITMAQLARTFPGRPGRAVIDNTGLKGRYDITYEQPFTVRPASNGQPHPPTPEPGRSASSIAHSLGLKLVPANRPVPTLVCDHIQRPTPN